MLALGQQLFERSFAVGRHVHSISFRLQVESQSLRKMRFILHHQHTAHDSLRGNSMVTVVPRPSPSLWAKTFPPCARAIARTMNNPSPVPFAFRRVGTR